MHLRKVRVTRRQFLLGAAVAATGAALDAYAIEPALITVSHHKIGDGTRSIRIVQLTDLHLREFGPFQDRIVERVASLQPDIILLTGDTLDERGNQALVQGFLYELRGPVKLVTLGNWEHWSGTPMSALRGTFDTPYSRLLVNETATQTVRGVTLAFVGLDSYIGGTPDLAKAISPRVDYTHAILIQHCPGYRDVMPKLDGLPKFQFMLSGHTHGGQVAPFGWAPFTPQGSGRYVKGWYRDGPIPMYVSRGIGTSVVPLRFFAPPEIAVFDLFV